MQITWIDIVLICALLFYGIEGFLVGAVQSLFDFLKFILSFLLGLKVYGFLGGYFVQWFHLPQGIGKVLGFFIGIFLAEIILHIVMRPLFMRIPKLTNGFWKIFNRVIGGVFGILSGMIFLMIILSIFVAVPVSPALKKAIASSPLADGLLSQTQDLEKSIQGVLGDATQETLNFLTVKPDSNSHINLDFKAIGTVDNQSEQQMLQMVNNERAKRGFLALVSDPSLQIVARVHAQDMLKRGYFSHYTPEGASPFDRMNSAGISYNYAGENLAFAPDVVLAMQGLMNSKGHRENILYSHFKKAGIGVLDAGFYGKMFVQEFTD